MVLKGLVMVQGMLNFNVVCCIIEMKDQKPLKTLSEIVKISNNHVERQNVKENLCFIGTKFSYLDTSEKSLHGFGS